MGCGGIGQAIALSLEQIELRGKITFVDPDIIDASNLQRYSLAFKENITLSKSVFLANRLAQNKNPMLVTYMIIKPYELAKSLEMLHNPMEEVFISVDNKRTRINLQAALPKMIWNVWTDTSEKTMRFGLGKHNFEDEFECLACSYYPDGDIPDQMELNSKILGLSEDELEEKLNKNETIKEEDLNYVFENFTIPEIHIQKVKSLVGKPFKEILHGECGIFNVKLAEKHEPTPAPHVPTLAGVYAVIQYVLSKINIDSNTIIKSVAEFDAFSYPNENCLIKKKKHKNCVCNDLIYQDAFKKKWQ